MTTGVDILFKELPTVSRADDRISRPDAPSVNSDYSQERSSVSRNDRNDEVREKSFTDHLENERVSDERPVTDNANNTRADNNDQNTPQERPASEDNNNNPNDQQAHAEQNIETGEKPVQQNSENETNVVSENASTQKPADHKPGLTTKDLLISEVAPEKAAVVSNQNSAINTENSENKSVPQTALNAVMKSSSEAGGNAEQNNNGQSKPNAGNGLQTALENNNVNAQEKAPVFAANTTEIPEETKVQEPTIATNNAAPASTKTATKPVIETSEQLPVNNAATDPKNTGIVAASQADETVKPVSNGGGIAEEVAKVLEQQKPQNQQNAAVNTPAPLVNEEVQHSEIGASVSAMAKAMKDQINNAELMQKPAPQPETVAMESKKTLPFAVVQSPNNAARPSSAGKKSGSSVTATKVTGASSANNVAAQAMQNSASQSALLNAQKSDIQLDMGLAGQKFDAPLGQSMTANGGSTLPNNSMLAAQDVNFQKTLSSVGATSKTDLPSSAKMINEQITVAINKNVVKGLNNFSIRLHPAELGQVDIKLEFAADGKMQASMMVENERTLSMLQRDQASLEKALQDAGINLSNKNLSFSLMKQNQQNNARHFANMTQSSNDEMGMDEFMDMASVQEIRMAYSNQALDISV
ncbi:flagellar hook-length control protein FliK [Pseudemcibacter aquimaris]|uniref:flagellar hook-length control protein FliK n=1 Tax=Pseudemcibacter aquimaris TaxID=2857064 RepID=UPI002012998D|nr:flagellar hook-length control protein FliK [Pseudemcibacter aquimaris]MCC3862224.1 flagellar hook-length control protein FliK [Pseudemcibacter aquimaris]WDU58976.1 flagellar hook-length control protein FliK [Pseudemcibacter aquimaris]